MIFILITVFIDVLGIGIIIPILPELIKEFVGGDTALAGRYVGVISAVYALMLFFFAPILGAALFTACYGAPTDFWSAFDERFAVFNAQNSLLIASSPLIWAIASSTVSLPVTGKR